MLRDPATQTLLDHQIHAYKEFIRATRGKKTLEIYEYALRRLLEHLGNISINDITTKHLDSFIIESTKTKKNITLNIQIRVIKAFFNCLKRWQVIQNNPSEGIKQLKVQEKIPVFFSQTELFNFLDLIKGDCWLYNLVRFAALTGTRLGEIIHLEWKNVDLPNKIIYIQSSVSYQIKSGKVRAIPMNDDVFDLLNNLESKEGYVFKGRRNKEKAFKDYVSRQFKQAVRKNGFNPALHFHSLRHTFASILAQKGVSLFFIQKLLGHSNISITQIYSHLDTSNLFSSVNLLGINNIQKS